MPLHMTRSLRGKALEAILPVLGVKVVAHLALVRMRVLLILAAKDALDAFANEIHGFRFTAAVSEKTETTLARRENRQTKKTKTKS